MALRPLNLKGKLMQGAWMDTAPVSRCGLLYVLMQGAVDGKSVRQAGLRGMNGIFLAYVDCADGTPLHAVPPDTVLRVRTPFC
eukprot:1152434-Pelagomonas_calceolata.AAC.3